MRYFLKKTIKNILAFSLLFALATPVYATPGSVWILLVAGGGASGGLPSADASKGGGAGGCYERNNYSISYGTFDIVVGSGGLGVSNDRGQNGATTSFNGVDVPGGGGGGKAGGTGQGAVGGSGGGSESVVATGTWPYGNAGGTTYGGGGGCQGVGGSGLFTGAGGTGTTTDISGTLTVYARGGNGGTTHTGYTDGGGGDGDNPAGSNNGSAGTNGRGTGGGGLWTTTGPAAGRRGGDGVVVIRYPQADDSYYTCNGTKTSTSTDYVCTFTASTTGGFVYATPSGGSAPTTLGFFKFFRHR